MTPLANADLDQLFHQARSIERFEDAELDPREVIETYELMRWGPTAMNISPLRLAVLPRGDQRESLLPLMSGESNERKVRDAPLVVIAAADERFHERLPELAPHRASLVEHLEGDGATRERMARENAHIQIGYLMLALRARGLHVGPLGGFDKERVDAEILTEQGWRSLLVLTVGRMVATDGVRPRAARLDARDAVLVLGADPHAH